MTQWPSITTGLGKLTPALWGRLLKMLKWYESQQLDYRRAITPFGGIAYFLASITDHKEMIVNQNVYRYSWTEVKLLEDDEGEPPYYDPKTDGRTGDKDDAATGALNLCELENDDENVSPGVDLDGADYPAGFNMMAIGEFIDGATDVDPVVIMFEIIDDTGETRWVFSLANAHDGTCAG